MAKAIVLIHSPLVGPSSWRWVANALDELGYRVAVPSLRRGAARGSWQECVQLAASPAREIDGDVVLVGHSGAGPLLPLIAAELARPPTRLVFVDAALPPARGDMALIPDDFADHLRGLAHDGVLPPWSEWFGPDTIAALIPDDERRRDVVADLSEIPLAYFDARLTLPEGWCQAATGAYILLSEVYRADASDAASRGWPTIEMIGGHMDLVTRPTAVADAIRALALE